MTKVRRALLSVSDKTGLRDFARRLEGRGVELVASGATAAFLRDGGVSVRGVDELTGRTELLGGRVKTLHPMIHAGILARRDRPEDLAELAEVGAATIDMVVCNLYPFAARRTAGASIDELRESVDIGGPAMLRAAAKNWPFVAAVADADFYDTVADELDELDGSLSDATRVELARRTFEVTAAYDRAIARWTTDLCAGDDGDDLFPPRLVIDGRCVRRLRYGENPHQRAALYAQGEPVGLAGAKRVKGEALSYNNLLDGDAAWRAVGAFDRPAAAVVKHLTPCGLAMAERVEDALDSALEGDGMSAFGGIVACNREFTVECAEVLKKSKVFIELILATGFTDQAVDALKKRTRLRLLQIDPFAPPPFEIRSIAGGLLVQEGDPSWVPAELKPVGAVPVPKGHETTLRFAWQAVAAVKSNAIVLAKDTMVVGVSGGQTSRVDAVQHALRKAGDRARGAVLASDAFFPFADSIEFAAAAGVAGVIQPGGSKRDDEVVAAADAAGLYMLFTGRRCFRH